MLKWASEDSLNTIIGRVIILIETGNQGDALMMRDQLMDDPKFLTELLTTVRPWPTSIVTVHTEEMNKHTSVKKIMRYGPDQ